MYSADLGEDGGLRPEWEGGFAARVSGWTGKARPGTLPLSLACFCVVWVTILVAGACAPRR